ncbi:MAG: hypothetical protein ACMUEM_01590 [Flavobacteriales bacterium AspAUS03]
MISGIKNRHTDDAKKVAKLIHQRSVKNIVITLGPTGALVFEEDTYQLIPESIVKAAIYYNCPRRIQRRTGRRPDSTKNLTEAVHFTCSEAAHSISWMGTRAPIPYRQEIDPPSFTLTTMSLQGRHDTFFLLKPSHTQSVHLNFIFYYQHVNGYNKISILK